MSQCYNTFLDKKKEEKEHDKTIVTTK